MSTVFKLFFFTTQLCCDNAVVLFFWEEVLISVRVVCKRWSLAISSHGFISHKANLRFYYTVAISLQTTIVYKARVNGFIQLPKTVFFNTRLMFWVWYQTYNVCCHNLGIMLSGGKRSKTLSNARPDFRRKNIVCLWGIYFDVCWQSVLLQNENIQILSLMLIKIR